MKIEMYKLERMNINVNEIENMELKYLEMEKAIFILKLKSKIIEANIETAVDYFCLFEFLRSINPCCSNKEWIGKFGISGVNEEVQHIMNLIRIDRIIKKMNTIICFDTVISILLDDYKDFGFNAMKIGNFEDNVKKAIQIFQVRKVA